MKGVKKFREYFDDVKPVTDEELEELLDDLSNKKSGYSKMANRLMSGKGRGQVGQGHSGRVGKSGKSGKPGGWKGKGGGKSGKGKGGKGRGKFDGNYGRRLRDDKGGGKGR